MSIEELKGLVITKIEGLSEGQDSVIFTTNNGRYLMYHNQDCCESVSIESVYGDIDDLLNHPIVIAEENSHHDSIYPNVESESWTWTFYKLATVKGYVDIRWYGQSNGYYSESVDFEKMEENNVH